jgi:putative DNA primase/helicase
MKTLEQLKTESRWVCYSADKVPINPVNGRAASSTDRATWADYQCALYAVQKFPHVVGIGIVFNGDGLIGIDIDDVIADKTNPYARHIVGLADSYTEVSPSKSGIHILGWSNTKGNGFKRTVNGVKIEIYYTSRYFTFTGDIIDDYEKIGNIEAAVSEIITDYTGGESTINHHAPMVPDASISNARALRQFEMWRDVAIKMMSNAIVGERHIMRLRAGRLLGGAIAAMSSYGGAPISIPSAIDLIYDALPPDRGEERKERKAIEWGIELGMTQPLQISSRPQQSPITGNLYTDDIPTVTIPLTYHFTDLGNGHRFVDQLNERVCYISEWQQWMIWNERYWERVDITAIRRLAHAVIIDMYKSAIKNEALDNELAKWALRSQTVARINAMIESAQPYLVVSSSRFDCHADYINLANGICNLQTGAITPHDRTWYFSKIIDIPYNPSADKNIIEQFMQIITGGDLELSQYIKRAVGYSMTGRTDEHCLFFAYGNGKNGKSTFMNMLAMITGEYATTTSIEALLDVAGGKGEGASPYMARLPGRRIAVAQEMPEGRRMNESLIKSITGGDRIATRDMYKSVFEFTPQHHLWISGNHKPRISGTDDGIWRRLRILPFTETIPKNKQRDSRVIEAEFYAHREGILRWMIEGSIMWYKIGLGSCKAVDRATTEYRGEEDAVARFITDRCEVSPGRSAPKNAMYLAWREWAQDEGDKSAEYKSQRWLTRQLTTRWTVTLGGAQASSLIGIGLRKDEVSIDDFTAPQSDREYIREIPMQ